MLSVCSGWATLLACQQLLFHCVYAYNPKKQKMMMMMMMPASFAYLHAQEL
jgi:hypothetical protein